MKKSLLLILASILALFTVTGCSDDSDGDNPPVDPALVQQIKEVAEGYYKVDFFYTDGAGFLPFSSNCSTATDMGFSEESCQEATTEGYGQIDVDDNGNMKLITKIQMSNATMATYAPDSQYNYTEYSLLPASSVDMSKMDEGTVSINQNNTVKGTTGRDLTKNTSDADATYSFSFDTQTNIITNTMTVTSPKVEFSEQTFPVNPITNVSIIMKKIQNLPDGYTMDKNKQFPSPSITGFVENPS